MKGPCIRVFLKRGLEVTFYYGEAKALTACAFTRKGYHFAGWNTGERRQHYGRDDEDDWED